MNKPILLRGASAGSGKTHFLAKTYIRLLLERYFAPEHPKDVYHYRHVLAVTFTNKATAEMKERILKELNILSKTPTQSDYYKDFVQYFSCTDEDLQKASGEILFHLLHEYGSFSVSTIDAFFQLVLRAFSREIGMYSSYQVELDRDALIGECVDRILDSLDEGKDNEELLKWLTDKAVYRVSNGDKFSADALLLSVATELMTVGYKEAVKKSPVSESVLYDHTRLKRLEKTCRQRREHYLAAVKDAAQAAADEAKLALGDVKTSREVLEKALEKLTAVEADNPKEGIPGLSDAAYEKLFLPVGAVNTDAWFKKADQAQFANGCGLKGLLDKMELLRQAYDEGMKMVATLDIIIPQLYGFGVVRRIRQELSTLMKEKNVLSLDETNEILKDLISDTVTPFIYEKVGVRYENFLLDEFQDTSQIQWDNFRPLLQESVDNGHTNLVVGDPKQSIYRWRNSDASLMTRILPEAFGKYIDDTNELDTNWRSAEEIVHFNNDFFAFAAQRMDEALNQGRVLQEVYQDVRQFTNHRKGGYIRLDFCQGRETEEGTVKPYEVEMEKVLSSIQNAVSHGFRYGDITIVVRKGSQGIDLAAYLNEQGIKVSTSDTLGIASSSIVRLLISLLSNRDDPNDSARAYLAGRFPSSAADAGGCSLVDICEELLRDIKAKRPTDFNAQIPYIRCFMDVLNDFVARGDNSLHSFVRYVSDRDDAISAPEAQDAVNIITIHKVKGLSAPYIIVPFLESIEWARVDGRGESVWCVPDLLGTELEGRADGVYQVNLTAGMAEGSHFEKSYQDERRLEYIDNLNVVYVAFTRPVEVLHIISAVPKKEEETASFPALLRNFAKTYMTEAEEGLYEKGTMSDYHPKVDKKQDVRLLHLDEGYPSYPRGERVKLRADASDFFKSETETPADSSRVNGTILHDILAHVVYPNELDEAVRAAVFSGELEAGKEQETLVFLRGCIDRAIARGWFPEPGSEWVVRNEATILVPKTEQNKKDENLRTDRVLDNGKEVIIIDYKTGDKHSSYDKQMEKYARAYLAMGRSRVTTHLWYLRTDEVETKKYA